jgi:hypothetical protein
MSCYGPVPFGMGYQDLFLILVIVVVVFGATKLPLAGNRPDGAGPRASRWTWADWALLGAAILSVSVAVALEIWKARHH